jgi:hypothetical protein
MQTIPEAMLRVSSKSHALLPGLFRKISESSKKP